ncbi:CPBP family intramembrane glutamic endopeptidase [Haloparvum sp. PAK95]|uniref:CPBP family intramembrane glutamic endopeptidase n=1 Tax=Haloparvum sp. PAK95 TaxID=3418962 RepID=UPI003D2F4F1D
MSDGLAAADVTESAMRLGQGLTVVLGAFLAAVAITRPVTDAVVGAGIVAADSPEAVIVSTVVQFLGFGLAIAVFLAITNDWDLIAVDRLDRWDVATVVGATIALLALQVAITELLAQFGVSAGENAALLPGRDNPTYFLQMAVVSVLVVGPAEELLFRGVVQGLLRRAMTAWPAIALTSVVFGIVHVAAVVGTTEQAFVYATIAAVLGVVLGYAYERTGNVVVPALTHGLYNGTLFTVQFLYFTGSL